MGGGSFRAAAKVGAGVGAYSGLRRGFLGSPAEHSVMRNASRPVSATISAGGGVTAEAPQPKSSWAMIDEPVLNPVYGGGDKQMMLPRLIFGAPPSLEEAKLATNELKVGLEKWSFNTEVIPKATTKVFELVCNNQAAQSVLASIAADPNVWDAMWNSPAVKDFIRSNEPRKNYRPEDGQSNNENAEEHSDEPAGVSKNTSYMFWVYNKIKSITGKVNDLPGLIERFFGTKGVENGTKDTQETDNHSSRYSIFGRLAILVFLLILGKRAGI